MNGSETKLILSLISRIGHKLPCNSGKKLEVIETDPLVQHIVNAIVDLSRFRLSVIANNLTQLLENISKSSSMVLEDFVPYEVLQSQLFILKILSACMTHHWKHYRGTSNNRITGRENRPSSADGTGDPTNGQTVNGTDSNHNVTDQGNEQHSTSRPFKLPKSWNDPPQLEDALAKYILGVLSRFLHQMANQEDHSPGSMQMGGGAPINGAGGPGNSQSWPTATYDIICEIFKNAGRVIFYISASNWDVVFTRIKGRISHLTTTNDEWPETAELKLLECSDLNSKRLSMVLQELCTSFSYLKSSAQTVMAVVLRKAIWNWIEVFPAEFVALCGSQRRMEGGPETLFDICNNLANNSSNTQRRSVFWPLQTMLLILCPDILSNAAMDVTKSRRAQFLNLLKKTLSIGPSRLADAVAVCYVDLCKASTYVSKNDSSALRLIVPEIENELRERLFQNRSSGDSSHIDQHLMTDCLTALFRLNPRNSSLIPICLQENAPSVYKLVLVKSCFAIASEENQLPWNPNISSMYPILASPLRKLFQDHIVPRDRIVDSNKWWKRGAQLDSERTEIILNILKLYKTDPMLAIVQNDSSEQPDKSPHIISGITLCLNDFNAAIRTTAAETLLALHDSAYIERWGPSSKKMQTFWNISSPVMLAVARQILELKEREEGTKYMLELLHELLIRRNEFLRANSEIVTMGINVPERIASNISLEIALLVLLCSADTEICTLAVTCIGHLCTEAQLTAQLPDDNMNMDDAPASPMSIVENINVYQELSSSSPITTRMAQQKRTRKLLRLMKKPTHGNRAAWEEAYNRWKVLSVMVARPPDDNAPDDGKRRFMRIPRPAPTNTTDITEAQTTEWHNYTGFLSALGGCCADDSQTESTLTESFSIDMSNSRVPANKSHHSMVEEFVYTMGDLLVCDSVYVREIVKETLGTDLSPRLYIILFRKLEFFVQKFFDADGDVTRSERHTLFVEQAISVLKLILDRIQDASESLYTVDFGGLVLSFARYLHHLGTGHVALRIKVKMCQLAEILMQKKDYITLRQEITLRNRLLEIIIEWTSDFALKTEGQGGSDMQPNKNERLHRDLDQACSKAIVALLHQLPLQPSETAHETDLSQAKSRLFYKYFSFFIKLLNRCRILEAIDNGTHSAKNNQDLQMLLSKSKEYVKDLGPLKDYTILALSNLLSANVDSGLKYSLSMGYHEDTKTRTAFMQVLTNILNQGAEFEGLAENAMNDRYDRLVELIAESDLSIVMSLSDVCPVNDIDEVAQLLITVFDSRNKTMALLKAIIEKEVMNTVNEGELFRRNCMATRLLAFFAKAHGAEYLRETVQQLLQELMRKPNDFSLELDPERLRVDENVEKNLVNLKFMAQSFLDVICSSASTVPRSFREICYYIATSVGARFPYAKYTAVGAFIFLRFFCPAIVAPDSENLVKSIQSREIRRSLLLITKIIQNLANNVFFGAKEPFMIVLNDFLSGNIEKVTTFLRDVSVLNPGPSFTELRATDVTVTPRLDDADRKLLHKHLSEQVEKIGKDLVTRRVKSINPTSGLSEIEQTQANRRTYDRLCTLLAKLGPPPENPQKEFVKITTQHLVTNNQLFGEFMRRNANRNVEPIASKRLFYEGGTSKERRPVFYFIASRLSAESTEMDLLLYYVLHTIEQRMARPYELVVDLTRFSHANEIQSQWIQQFIQILPFDAIENLASLYFYNTNTAFKKFSKKLPRNLSQKIGKKAIFLCSLSELHEHISQPEVRLPRNTIALDTEQTIQFMPVTKIAHYRVTVPVVMKVSNETIQVSTVRKQDLFYNHSCILNDVYHISEIEDITLSSHKSEDNEFVIKQDNGQSSITFTSPKRDMIMQAIRASKARFQLAKPSNVTERVIRPADVPGTLLNMALLNIGSDDPNLRLAAYNLLVALSVIFNFDVDNQLLSAKGLCIPANNSKFVEELSAQLALSEPDLTLEFLSEFFVGFNKSNTALKHLCLQYMAPWLLNLGNYSHNGPDNQVQLKRTREILRHLIELTVKEFEMYTSVQSKVWSTLGKVDEITNIIIDEFVNYAVKHGISSPQAETVANTIVTLSSVNVRGKIIARLRRVIMKTSQRATRTLTENPVWPEIAVLVRFNLMLSFSSRLHVQLYLPELFYIVSLLVATGPPLIRASIHGLVVNLIQSLCTVPRDEDNLNQLSLLLSEFSEPKFRLLFGLSSSAGNAFATSPEAAHEVAEMMPLSSLEQIVQALLEVMLCGAPSDDVSNAWRARWMGLVASTAFQHNPAIQPRAFVALGCLACEEVDDDLLYQILVALKGALTQFNDADVSLIISIIMCLTNIVENLTRDSIYLQTIFWPTMSLVQINHPSIFASAVKLLQVVLRALDINGFFVNEDIKTFLLKVRARGPLAEISAKMDSEAGINYEHFSFAVSAALLKGLKNPSTKTDTQKVLQTFLEIASKGIEEQTTVDASMLGYLAALLPISARNGEMKELLCLCGIFDTDVDNSELANTYYKIFQKLNIPNNQTALLLVSLMVAMLQNAEQEPERLFLYGFLSEAATAIPEVFALVYDNLHPKLTHIVTGSETIPILDAVQSILYTVVSEPLARPRGNQMSFPEYLEEIGFKHLMECGSFHGDRDKMRTNAALASQLVNKIVGGS